MGQHKSIVLFLWLVLIGNDGLWLIQIFLIEIYLCIELMLHKIC